MRTERLRYFVVGEKGKTIRNVAEGVEQSLKQYYLNEVRVKLIVKKGTKNDFNSAKSLSEEDKEMLRKLS